MGDSKVDTISRLAQWKIENFGPCSYKKSDPFKVGKWNWHLSIEKNRYLYIRFFPETSRVSKEQPPIARFVLRVSTTTGPARKPYISPVHERMFRVCEDFVWPVDCTFHGRFVIDVEFLDLKICPLAGGGEASSIWPGDETMQSVSIQGALQCLSRMLDEGIHSDVTIQTADGTLKAHKAILSATSPVFQSMFKHDLKEKESSIIHIKDISLESCMALLSYLYGTIKEEEFWRHRQALLGAAHKYDIADLKDACEDSLLEDISSENVLERLQDAWLYQLNKLKKGCMTYLFDFGKIYDVRDEMNSFFKQADRELMLEMFQEVLTVWRLV
jgi:speckle-type POZ protein